MLFNLYFPLQLMTWTKQTSLSLREYIPHCEPFGLKLGMCGEEGLLTNFPKFNGDRATSTMFSQHCRKTYWTDLVFEVENLKNQILRKMQVNFL